MSTTTELIYSTDLSYISGIIYDYNASGTPIGTSEINIHIPFFIWTIIGILTLWLGARLLLEFIIRFRN